MMLIRLTGACWAQRGLQAQKGPTGPSAEDYDDALQQKNRDPLSWPTFSDTVLGRHAANVFAVFLPLAQRSTLLSQKASRETINKPKEPNA